MSPKNSGEHTMNKVYTLMTQWRDEDPRVSGIFSSFDKAAMYFARTRYKGTASISEMQSASARAALKLAHLTNDEDFTDFGDIRAWVDEHIVDEHCESFEEKAELT